MRVPNFESALVPRRKLTESLLSPSHPVGESKADYFSRFGFLRDNWEDLAGALLQLVAEHDVIECDETEFGTSYVVEGPIEAPDDRRPCIRSVWFIGRAESIPRLVTVYPASQRYSMQELDTIALAVDLPEFGLERGDLGAIVHVYADGAAFEVEFVTLDGQTVALTTLRPDQIRPTGGREIAHLRPVGPRS